jgi:hypothetical protein
MTPMSLCILESGNNVNINCFKQSLSNVSWNNVYQTNDINVSF